MRKIFGAAFIVLLVVCSLGFSQERTGNIYGTLVDDQGQPLPGARVVLTGSKISKLEALTTEAGVFRFLSLAPADDYRIVAELQGFKTVVQENIIVRIGVNVDLKLVMPMSTIEQQIIVTAKQPVVDTKKMTVQNIVTREAMQILPSSRDPWAILELASGIMMDRENIGGSESGQQANFVGRGDSGNNAQWNLDGVNISDPSAVGASPMYWDFDMLEEVIIQTGANDVTALTGGINISFVTPRGGNRLKGGARFFLTDKSFQSDNLTPELRGLELAGNKVHSIYDYGFNIGGPIFKDKLWFWGAFGGQDINQINITGQRDDTDLTNYNFKLNSQLGNHRLEFYGNHNVKQKDGRRRAGGYLDQPEATWIQTGPGWVFKLQDEVNIGQNFFLSTKVSYVPSAFSFDPKGGRGEEIWYWDRGLDIQYGTNLYYDTNRPQLYGEVTGNLYLERFLGANHEFKFGAEYKNAVMDSTSDFGVQARLKNGVPYEVRLYSNQYEKFYANRASAYVQDVISLDRLTLNLGLRYDRQWGGVLDGSVAPTNYSLMENIGGVDYNFPAATQKGADFPFTWNMFSPRLGFTFDLFGDKKTLVKGNFSIYGSQFDATAAYNLWWLWGIHYFSWDDLNGDKQPQSGELTYTGTNETISMAPDTPNLIKDYFDKDLTPEKTMEILVGIEHELISDFAVGLNFQYRKLYDYNFQRMMVYDYLNDSAVRQVRNEDWIQAGTIEGQVYWDLDPDLAGATGTNFLTKQPDYYQTYWALEFSFKKRLSNRWMLDGSFTYNDHRAHFLSRNSYTDPTDHLPVDKLDGKPQAYQAAGSGSSDVYMNSRWMFKLAGLYQLPYGFTISGTFTGREGFISPLYALDYDHTKYDAINLVFSEASVWLEEFGKIRDPNVFLLNFRLEKKFNFGRFGNVYLSADAFNALNSNVRLAQVRNKSSDNFGQTLCIMSPRIFRLGMRFEF